MDSLGEFDVVKMPQIDPKVPIPGVFLMKPTRPGRASGDLFRERLDAIIDMRHPLVRLQQFSF